MQKRQKTVRKETSPMVRTFARRLREIRRERGLSQMKLAVRADIHISYLGRLERGESTPSIDTVAHIAHALGAAPVDLLTGQSSPGDLLSGLRSQAQENVSLVIKRSDRVALQALAVVAAALARAR